MITFRRARWLGVAVAYAVALACADHSLEAPNPHPESAMTGTYIQNPRLQLDIVFGIDDSGSMKEEQTNLIANFPRFIEVLQAAVPPGTTLDAHIGIVSSDLGVGTPGLETRQCGTNGGDNGAFQSQPRGTCTATNLNGSYIVSGPEGNNFTGAIEEVFSCIAPLGITGCGFEHQLASVRRALGGDPDVPAPPENAGFLRDGARLGIILITDEDDCSAPYGSDLFTTDTTVYGPMDSYRCNQFGHLCGGTPPPQAVVSGLTCESNETDSTHLIKVADFVDFFRSLKPNPNLLRVAAISGPPSPYATHISPEDGTTIQISPSCESANGLAAPAVRLAQFVNAFGSNGLFETICRDDFRPAMEHIAKSLAEVVPPCVSQRLYDTDLATPGIQPDCTVEETAYAEGVALPSAVPGCDHTGGATPCWRLVPDATNCATTSPDGLVMSVDHGTTPPQANTNTKWSCRVCATPGEAACAR